MRDRELYGRILGLEKPWSVIDVIFDADGGEIQVLVDVPAGRKLTCPECGKLCSRYDARVRRWRHLDTCQYRTILVATVPRINCPKHGVVQVGVPWGEPGSRFTALFEGLVIDWLLEAPISAVARQLGLTWTQVDGIRSRAVARGLARRNRKPPTRVAVDETSYQKGHQYITVVSTEGVVVHVADDRKKASLDEFYSEIGPEACAKIESVTMDMSPQFIGSTQEYVPNADAKIVFDRFHVAGAIGAAVDEIRRKENRELLARSDERLKGSRYKWLWSPENMSRSEKIAFADLRDSSLRTARAWAMKDTASRLWGYTKRGWAERSWKAWVGWVQRSRLEPMKKVARMILRHWTGVINAAVSPASNGIAESLNAKIQKVKRMACGFRNRQRFRDAIYFHLGDLDLYPASIRRTHSNP